MKKLKIRAMKRKGSMYMLESAIAIIIMITTLALILRNPPTPRELDTINYKQGVYNVLKVSDEVGDLRVNVLNNNTEAIKNEIETNAHQHLDYEVVIYNRTHGLSAAPATVSENIATVSYFLAGHVKDYEPNEVRVFIWGFD